MIPPRGLLRGFRSDPAVANAFATYAERKDRRSHALRPAHNTAATALWSYIMATPSQHWLRRLRSFIPPLPPHFTGGGVYTLVSPCTKKFYIGKTNNFQRRLGEHLSASSRITTRSTAPVHRQMRGAGAPGFVMLPLVYACPDDDIDALERILIRRLQPSLNVVHTSRSQHKRPRPRFRSTHRLQPTLLHAIFSCNGHQSHDLTRLLHTRRHSGAMTVTCAPGAWHLVNRRALSLDYGASTVTITSPSRTTIGRLRGLMSCLHTATSVHFHTVLDASIRRILDTWKLALLLHPRQTAPQLAVLPPRHLIALYSLRPQLPPDIFSDRPCPNKRVCCSCPAHSHTPPKPIWV